MILFTSTGYIKTHTGLNDNTYDKMIIPALVRAQDIDLTEVLGVCLMDKLRSLINSGDISASANAMYKTLLDNYIQPFLAYSTISQICIELGQVIGNGGIDTITDEHRQSLSFDERNLLKDYWKNHAGNYRRIMIDWLRKNKYSIPEWKECGCRDNREAPYTNLFLGGRKGKKV